MAVIAGRTREQIDTSVGYNLGALYVGTTNSSGASDGTTAVDTNLQGGDDVHNGKWLIVTSGTNDGEIRRVTDYVQSSGTLTVATAFTAQVASSVTYQLWDEIYDPSALHDFENQAILETYGRAFDTVEDISLHGDGKSTRFDVPSGISMISKLERRSSVDSIRVHEFGTTFDETTDGDFTQSLDTEDKKQGAQSLKVVIAAGASADDKITDSITSIDISRATHLEFWIKSTVALSAGQMDILLDDTAACASPLETLDVPAVSKDTWTFCRVILNNPELDTAIISVGFRYTTDIAAVTIWLDDMSAVVSDSAVWQTIPQRIWTIDPEEQDLIFTPAGRDLLGYRLLKIKGGDKPALLSSASSTLEIDDEYVIARTTFLSLSAHGRGPTTDADNHNSRAGFWYAVSQRAMAKFPILHGARMVE
jgi:hypothetical protein